MLISVSFLTEHKSNESSEATKPSPSDWTILRLNMSALKTTLQL